MILRAFAHDHNPLDVARQEYELAKRHFREVLRCRDSTDPRHEARFRDAVDRQDAARDRYVAELCR